MKRKKHVKPAHWTHKTRNPLRSAVKSQLGYVWSSMCNEIAARNSPDKTYDDVSEMGWADNAGHCFNEARELLLKLGWEDSRISQVYENMFFRQNNPPVRKRRKK